MATPQTDGDRHDRLTYITSPIAPVITGGLAWWNHAAPESIAAIALASLATHIAGGLYLSPDLDLRGGFRCKSWWRWERAGLGWAWLGYPHMAGCHRSAMSHAPILGTVTRLSYPALIAVTCLPAAIRHWRRSIATISLAAIALSCAPWWAVFPAALFGVETSAIAHYTQDGILFGPWHKPKTRKAKHRPTPKTRRSQRST